MHPVTHVLIGWTLANTARLERRDCMLVTVAGFIPDFDGLGVIADILTEKTSHPLYFYDTFHHCLMHNLGFGLFLVILTLAWAKRRIAASLLVILSFHLHLLGDIVGSRGPDGYQWPIPYLEPFSDSWQLTWSEQWGLKAWPNVTLTLLLMALTLYWTWKRGRSPIELVSSKSDSALVRTLRNRFGDPRQD